MTLPHDFAALEPFVAQWAKPSLSARDTARLDSSEAERLAFYRAAGGMIESAQHHLADKKLADLSEPERNLHYLLLSMIHVSLAVEVQRDAEPLHARGARRMPILHAHSDR